MEGKVLCIIGSPILPAVKIITNGERTFEYRDTFFRLYSSWFKPRCQYRTSSPDIACFFKRLLLSEVSFSVTRWRYLDIP